MGDPGGPAVGSRAPEFTAPLAAPDGSVTEASLSSLVEDGAVLLVFQPTDFDLEGFAERRAVGKYDWFAADDRIRVVGINRARPRTNREFIDYLDVTYPFCSDRDLSIARSYGATYRAFGVAPRARRACFVVDCEGVVRYRWIGDRGRRDDGHPQVENLYAVLTDLLGRPDPDSFGLA
ncbi:MULTISPECIES: redoxin domain-containing protein [Halorussus]|uniref:redoxin domain-containing protein n=1 Tax=Halorussus TaxID=1070314 RepID=UPI0013B41FB2|nr:MULTISPECIES: redoxin domain-containing protein [Halorussus]NHN57622.1 redoxin domain-containing protein [Halorussus sp. JP-T4]